jgi:DNA repair protein SbcC/Rad50
MRPLKLKITNFTCFREPTVELDFVALNLFAITGPTGSGKSSLLDAMIFALYGRVPRMGARGLSELIALGRDRMAVVFDFRIGSRTFRVARTARRRGATEVQLDELTTGGELPIAGNVRDTEEHVVRLLGLPYEAFTQAVVLPQGQFAKFLQSAPGQRRDILRELLRLQIYERMRNLATQQRNESGTRVELLERQLAEDFVDATSETLTSLRSEERRLATEIATTEAELKSDDAALKSLRLRHEKSRELEQKRSQLAGLIKRETAIKKQDACIEGARRAGPVLPLIQAISSASARAESAGKARQLARDDRDKARTAEQRLKTKLQKADDEARRLPRLREEIAALDRVVGQLKSHHAVQKRLNEASTESIGLQRDLLKAEKQQRETVEALKQHEVELAKATKASEQVGYDSDLDRRLDEVRNEATTLASLREAATAKATEARDASSFATIAQEGEGRALDQAQKAKERLEGATERKAHAQAALESARQRHAAAILRGDLRLGEPCPVCDQAITKRPARIDVPHLPDLENRLSKANQDEANARDTAEQKREAATKAQADAKSAQRAADKAGQELAQFRRKLDELDGSLDREVGKLVAEDRGSTIEVRVQNAVKRIAVLRKRFEEAVKTRETAQKTTNYATRAAEKAEGDKKRIADLLAQAQAQMNSLKAEVARINLEIGKVTKAPDPKAERERLAGVYTDLEDTLNAARKEYSAAEKQLAAAEVKAQQTAEARTQAARDLEATQLKARDAVVAAGFPDESAAKNAALAAADIKRLEIEVRTWQRDRDATQKRVTELEGQLNDGGVSAESLRAAEAQFLARKTKYDAARDERARLSQRISQVAERVKRAKELTIDLGLHRQSHTLYAQLADDLRSDRFQAFLLEEVFRDLVQGASERLWSLSNRYGLQWQNENFLVVDHDNARQLRSADTLSGGETFMASLALALELSEQVQRASGAVPLDSIFIDEGFGTLDPEALNSTAEAIESLQTGGRLVGIITHLEGLSERLPARINVQKHAEGSQLEILTA